LELGRANYEGEGVSSFPHIKKSNVRTGKSREIVKEGKGGETYEVCNLFHKSGLRKGTQTKA